MKIVIEIPDHKVPSKQELLSVGLHFIDGHVCECTYPFEELKVNLCEDTISREDGGRMSEKEKQAMNKEDNKYDEFGFFNPFSVNHEKEQEPCGDVISRQAALDAVCESQCGCKMSDCEYLFADCPEIEKIEQLPPVNEQRLAVDLGMDIITEAGG